MRRHKKPRRPHPLFEPLESRLLLSGDGLVDADPGPVEPNGVVFRMLGVDNDTDDADGDGKLGLNDVPTKSAMGGEAMELTLASDEATPVPCNASATVWDDSPIVHAFAEPLPDDMYVGATELNALTTVTGRHNDGLLIMFLLNTSTGDEAENSGPSAWAGVDNTVILASRPIIENILGSTENFETTAAPEPTSLTFNGRGIDLNDDMKIDSL